MYGQGYRNKADRKRNSRFVVSDKKLARIRAEKEGGYAQNKKPNPSYCRGRKYLTKPSAFESEITHRTKQRVLLRVFRPAGVLSASGTCLALTEAGA